MIKIRLNYIYAIISITLVLFLTGVFGTIVIQSQQLVKLFKERVMLVVEVNKGFPNEDVKNLKNIISEKSYVKPSSVVFTSKEEAAKMMQEDFGTGINLDEFNLGNPLYDVITFHVKSHFVDVKQLEEIAQELKNDERVSDVSYEGNVANTISNYWSKIGWLGLVVSLILGLVAIVLIVYSIRQALYTDRFLIKNMHLVGATPAFISSPYVKRGVIGGVASAVLAAMGLLLLRSWLVSQVVGMNELFTLKSWAIIALILLVFGIFITAGSTLMTVRNYLKSDINKLYN